MKIPVHYYFQTNDISGIVRISSHWSEESSGYENEHIDETIAGKESDKFYLIDAHLKIKTMGGEDFDIINKKEISKDTYDSCCEKHGGVIDTQEYRETFNQITKTQQELENSYPSCPKCNTIMAERSGRYGIFGGCSAYPNCNGTRKIEYKSAEIKGLRNSLGELNFKIAKLEK